MNTSKPFRSLDVDAAAADPSLVGYSLTHLRQAQNITAEQQAERLSTSTASD
jgi:hypothetical protein